MSSSHAGLSHPGPKHRDEFTSRDDKFHVNSLHRPKEQKKPEGGGWKKFVPGEDQFFSGEMTFEVNPFM